MFLSLLTPNQADIFVQAAQLVLEADGDEHQDAEIALLEAVKLESGSTRNGSPSPLPEVLAAAAAELDDPTQRSAFLLELAGVAVVDGHEHAAEMDVLREFAAQLGLDAQLDDFLTFARDARDLAARGNQLITG